MKRKCNRFCECHTNGQGPVMIKAMLDVLTDLSSDHDSAWAPGHVASLVRGIRPPDEDTARAILRSLVRKGLAVSIRDREVSFYRVGAGNIGKQIA